jgi:NADPH:quinone reductase-like Zn-dependent oxidoreductase
VAKETAKIVRFHAVGGPEVLKIHEEPIPEPGKGEVRLNVKAIGLNRAEVMFRSGQYLESPVLPSKLGYEAAGVVKPRIDRVFPFAQIVEAHRYMESNEQIGKIVVTV